MGTTYFLGAGASKSILASMPTAAELTVAHLLREDAYPNGDPPRTAIPELKGALANGHLESGFAELRVEEALTKLFRDEALSVERHNLQVCLCRRLGTPHSFIGTYSFHIEAFLRSVHASRDVIITTNYDTLIEAALGQMDSGTCRPFPDGFPVNCGGWVNYGADDLPTAEDPDVHAFGLLGEERGSLLILKLHGSISWNRCMACGFYDLDPLHNFGAEEALDGYAKCGSCGSHDTSPVLVPPTFEKSYDDRAIQGIWKKATEVLATSERVVFAGFSLHPSDDKIGRLLSQAAAAHSIREVQIVDPAAENLLPRFEAVFGGSVSASAESWSRYVERVFSRL